MHLRAAVNSHQMRAVAARILSPSLNEVLMTFITRTAAACVLLTFAAEATVGASVGSRRSAYVGGTIATFGNATEPIKGTLQTTDSRALVFHVEASGFSPAALDIPYANVVRVEYGQKAGRRVGAAIGYSIIVGPAGLLALLSKKRHHYVTVEYLGSEGASEVAVFEVGKDVVRSTLATVESRSGKSVAYLDADARLLGMR
ncbi:MAG: hypothetical protein ABIU95_13995 [Burkholderiales bacterium]